MNKVGWIIFGVVIVGLLGGLIAYSRLSNPSANVSSIDANSIVAANDQNGQIADHVIGNTDSKVILIEYGDFQCPSCGGAHPQIKEITEEYKDKVLFIFRNFPLTTIHPNARAAAGAVEAAGLQGKYWEMYDVVFENQSEWESLNGTERTDKFISYAVELGLNKDTFLKDIASTNVNQKISFDQAIGKKINVDSTPSFYLNGEPLDDAVSSSIVQGSTTELKALLDEALGR
ncbi:MAG: thioredoxin domain-containing protein [Candidatus Microsaccharimonas sp.]